MKTFATLGWRWEAVDHKFKFLIENGVRCFSGEKFDTVYRPKSVLY